MCGIFGAIGTNPNASILRSLALLNESRGRHALGFFGSDIPVWKRAGAASDLLTTKDFCSYHESWSSCWFVGGHTRFPTRGKNTSANAHPFVVDRFTLSHNGCVSAPHHFEVDSMWFPHLLGIHDGDYQKSFENVDGYWSLAWTDGKSFFLQCWLNELAMIEHDSVVYYSSDARHLSAAVGLPLDDVYHFDPKGETWQFHAEGRGEKMADFKANKTQSRSSMRHWSDYSYLDDVQVSRTPKSRKSTRKSSKRNSTPSHTVTPRPAQSDSTLFSDRNLLGSQTGRLASLDDWDLIDMEDRFEAGTATAEDWALLDEWEQAQDHLMSIRDEEIPF